MEQSTTDVCILGGGPTGLLANLFLRQEHVQTTIVARLLFGALAPIRQNGTEFTPVPIFINAESALFRRIPWSPHPPAEPLHVSHMNAPSSLPAHTIERGSYAEFLLERYEGAALPLVLADKHLGPQVYRDPLPEVRRKVNSHYARGQPRARRIGFSNGLSPYLSHVKHDSGARHVAEAVTHVDVQRKIVTTPSRQISYARLISTLPLGDLLRLCGIDTELTMSAAGAHFVVLGTNEATTPNQMLYDCAPGSPIYRTFIPTERIILIQTSRSTDDPATAIPTRARQLLGLANDPVVLHEFRIDACYPLAVSSYEMKAEMLRDLSRRDITVFGRFGQWEYLDLDELDWEKIA